MDTKEKIEIMQAWLDGKNIEYKVKDAEESNEYELMCFSNPGWDWSNFDYRIEKKIKKRPMSIKELLEKGARYIHDENETIFPLVFNMKENKISWGAEKWHDIDVIGSKNYRWSTNGLNLKSFEVEE